MAFTNYSQHCHGSEKDPQCKGRWLAVYEIKAVVIILLSRFEFSATREKSGGWVVPRVHPRSIGVIHTEDDICVRLSPRKMEPEEDFERGKRDGELSECTTTTSIQTNSNLCI